MSSISKEVLERLNNKQNFDSSCLKEEDVQRIIQELDIYHAELLAQNEELIFKEQELQNSQLEYESLFNESLTAYIIIDADLVIEKYNFLSLETFNVGNYSNHPKSILSIISAKDINIFLNWIKNKEYLYSSINLNIKCKNSLIQKFKVQGKIHALRKDSLILSFLNIQKEYDLLEKLNFANSAFDIVLDENKINFLVLDENKNMIKASNKANIFFKIEKNKIKLSNELNSIKAIKEIDINKLIKKVLETNQEIIKEFSSSQNSYYLSIKK